MAKDAADGTMDDCPPKEAPVARGRYYRWCSVPTPDGDHYKSYKELGLAPKADPCKRRALSMMDRLADAVQHINLFPQHGYRYVMQVEFTGVEGHAMRTTGKVPSHASWWPRSDLKPDDRAKLFAVACEVVP